MPNVPLFQSALEKNSADLRMLQSQQMQNRQLQDQIQQLQAMQTRVQEHQASVTRTLQHQQQQQEVVVLQTSSLLKGSVIKYVNIATPFTAPIMWYLYFNFAFSEVHPCPTSFIKEQRARSRALSPSSRASFCRRPFRLSLPLRQPPRLRRRRFLFSHPTRSVYILYLFTLSRPV